MGVEIENRVVVLHDTYVAVDRADMKEGEIVTVVATKPNASGGMALTVSRDGETALHYVHSSGVVPLQGRPIAEMSVVEMAERYIEIAAMFSALNASGEDCEELFYVGWDQQKLILQSDARDAFSGRRRL